MREISHKTKFLKKMTSNLAISPIIVMLKTSYVMHKDSILHRLGDNKSLKIPKG